MLALKPLPLSRTKCARLQGGGVVHRTPKGAVGTLACDSRHDTTCITCPLDCTAAARLFRAYSSFRSRQLSSPALWLEQLALLPSSRATHVDRASTINRLNKNTPFMLSLCLLGQWSRINSVAAVAGALAWTGVADEAAAGTARPSARNLAEASIEVGVGRKVPASLPTCCVHLVSLSLSLPIFWLLFLLETDARARMRA